MPANQPFHVKCLIAKDHGDEFYLRIKNAGDRSRALVSLAIRGFAQPFTADEVARLRAMLQAEPAVEAPADQGTVTGFDDGFES